MCDVRYFGSFSCQIDLTTFFLKQFLPYAIEGTRVLPLVTFPLVYFFGGDEMWVAVGVFVFLLMLLMLVAVAVLNTGDENPGRLEKIAR